MAASHSNSIDALDTLNARLEQVRGILSSLQVGTDNEFTKAALWGAGTLLDQALEAAGQLR